MTRKTGGVTLVTQPEAFFRELVVSALGRQQVQTKPETEFYLVNLLNQFIKADRLYTRDAEGNVKQEPLAIMLREALDEATLEAQRLMLRHVGDVSLYVAGFFQDSLNRKLVDVDYYIDMGGVAYKQVAARAEDSGAKTMYRELSEKFARFVDVFAEVSDQTTQKTEKDILRQYDLWVRTKSDRAAKVLKDAGILPNRNVKKNVQ